MKMKVTNKKKGVLVFKSITGKEIHLKGGKSKIFKKEEFSLYGKSCLQFKKLGWCSVVPASNKAEVVADADAVGTVAPLGMGMGDKEVKALDKDVVQEANKKASKKKASKKKVRRKTVSK